MFEKFGEFDSFEEINKAARAQKEEGDLEAIRALAAENGVDADDAEAFIDGDEDELTNARTAAIGKLDIEEAEYEVKGFMRDWVDILRDLAVVKQSIAKNIRQKGKSLAKWLALCIDESAKEKFMVSGEITKHCSKDVKELMGGNQLTLGGIDSNKVIEIAYSYYGGEA